VSRVRVFLQIVWFVVLFLGLFGLTTLVVASFLQGPIYPEQFGYAVGRYVLWPLLLAGVLVIVGSPRGWLPGIAASTERRS
jgi:hypothetical protein